jgi:hypothetical protein
MRPASTSSPQRRMYREMDMRFWLEQVVAEMRELA